MSSPARGSLRRVLALDTSCWWGGVALAQTDDDERVEIVAELGLTARDSHAVHLMRWVGQLLDMAGWERESVDAYVATRGPGSFTGLRIGFGTLRGLALAAGKPCGGVVTLAALAEAAGPAERPRATLIDGGRGELFFARYEGQGSPPVEVAAPAALPVAEALARCAGDELVVPADRRTAQALFDAGATVPLPVRGVAGAAARLALLDPDGVFAPSSLEPLYVRASDAELNLRRG